MMPARKYICKGKKMSGLALVELTVVLPVLFIIMLASVECGRVLYSYNTLTKLTRDAVRLLSTRSYRGTVQDIELTPEKITQVKNFLVYANDTGGSTALLRDLNANQISVSSSGNFVIVAVDYPFESVFGNTLAAFIPNIDMNMNLHAEVSMRAIN